MLARGGEPGSDEDASTDPETPTDPKGDALVEAGAGAGAGTGDEGDEEEGEAGAQATLMPAVDVRHPFR